MLGPLFDHLVEPWRPQVAQLLANLANLRDRLLPVPLRRLLGGPPRTADFPLTRMEHLKRAQAYLESLDRDAVLRLVSSQCNAPCRYLEHGINHTANEVWLTTEIVSDTPGAYQKRIVRIPLDPATYKSWEVVRSEVCTNEYIRKHTQIPVPKIHAYGRARLLQLGSGKQCYMILDFVEGHQLTMATLRDGCTPELRKRLFENLINIMVQLRPLEFKAGGSLKPHWLWGTARPAISAPLTRHVNTIRTKGQIWTPPRAKSVEAFMDGQYDVLGVMMDIPIQDADLDVAYDQMFALGSLSDYVGPPEKDRLPDRFILSLAGVEPYDIVVDDQCNIVAITQWKWAATAPAVFAPPPHWILDSPEYRAEFDAVLGGMKRRRGKNKLTLPAHDWLARRPSDMLARVAHIFESPSVLPSVVRWHIHPRLTGETWERATELWFRKDPTRLAELENRLEVCQEYVEALEHLGVYDPDEGAIDWEDLLDDFDEFLQRRAARQRARAVRS